MSTLRVTTAHSEYLIDQDAKTFTRRRVHQDASVLPPGFGDEVTAYSGFDASPGASMVIYLENGGWIHSTTVLSVEEVPPSE